MKIKLIILLLAAAGLLAFKLSNKPKTLLVLGDSISLGYGKYLEMFLKDEFVIQRKGSQERAMKNLDVPIDANGGDSRMVLDYLKSRITDTAFHPNLMLLNCGLHDIKRNTKTLQIAVDSAQYRANLQAIYKLLAAKRVAVMWVRTTEVVDSIHNPKSIAFSRFAKDLDEYNRIADETCKKFSIPEIDLYTFTRKQGNDRFADHVHYIPKVVEAQGKFITKFVKRWLRKSQTTANN